VSSPNPIERPPAAVTAPSFARNSARSIFHVAAARSISISRAVAAARASTGAMVGVVREFRTCPDRTA
jgi:hypothetical protein